MLEGEGMSIEDVETAFKKLEEAEKKYIEWRERLKIINAVVEELDQPKEHL